MLSIRLLCVGKLKERHYMQACREYEKRLSGLCRLEVVELAEEPPHPHALMREGQRVLAAIPPGSRVVALCIEGKAMGSPALARYVEAQAVGGASRLCFIIGGSLGLDAAVKGAAHLRLSMSPMTFPHHLARVMVLEQIYRALSILGGSQYHK